MVQGKVTTATVEQRLARITRIADPALLGRVSLTKPFAHYVVEASRHARSVFLLARNARNKLVFWRSLPDVQDLLNPKGGEVLGEIPLPRGPAAQRAPAASAIAR